MQRVMIAALAISAFGLADAMAQPMPTSPSQYESDVPAAQPVRYRAAQPDLGGGFIEFLFGGGNAPQPRYQRAQPERNYYGPMQGGDQNEPLLSPPPPPAQMYVHGNPTRMEYGRGEPAQPAMDPRYLKQTVDYDGREAPGSIVIDTPKRFLYLVQPGGKALRYGIGVGKPGFAWAGVKTISQKREWPDWRPPKEMLKRRPDLPTFMAGGPDNPLGARAMYLGSSLYRIHGSNEPWTIGHAVSSGCIRMRNEDVIDLYERVKVGTKVVVI